MYNFLLLKLKEGRKKSSFVVYALVGSFMTLIISFMTFSTNQNLDISSDYGQYGYQWTGLILLAALASVSICAPSAGRHKKGNFTDLLSLHGLKKKDQYWGIFLANVITSFQMALLLGLAMLVSLLIKRPASSPLNFILASLVYLTAISSVSFLITGLSFFISPLALNLIGVLLVILASLRGVLDIVLGNLGGAFPNFLRLILKALPPIGSFATIARDLFFGEFSSWNLLFSSLFYLWLLLGLVALIIHGVAKYEK
ncbi:MAG: hypothetical protein Q4E36_02615 [Bacillota bacterium]|nr:hypothetical protein [Bacillota bacterium]